MRGATTPFFFVTVGLIGIEGVTYELLWSDENIDGTVAISDFEFYFGYIDDIAGHSEQDAIELIQIGDFLTAEVRTDLLENQWFTYTLPNDGSALVN